MKKKRREPGGAKTMSDERVCRWAMLTTMRTLRLSVRNGRPISLPNLLRLFQRRCGECAGSILQKRAYHRLKSSYRQRQPFL
jgi:hypothetical protein